MSLINTDGLMITAMQAILKAGDLLRKGFGTACSITSKSGNHNLVTQFDQESEECIFTLISKQFPSHGFMGEEQGHRKTGEISWIVDPLDGTVNFAHGIPIFCISIAAVLNQEVILGCVYQPITQELFWAQKGKGAYLNGARLRVSDQSSLACAFAGTGFPYDADLNPMHCLEAFSEIIRRGIPVRRLGSAAIDLAYMAAGRFDVFWEVLLQPWDFAAGALLVAEAGGRVTHYDGGALNFFNPSPILATNTRLHREVQEILLSSFHTV